MYFTFDRLEVDNKRKSIIGIWREHTRRVSRHSYRTEKKQHWYSVSPVFEDSLPEHKYAEREVKAWVVAVKHDKQDSLVCYEWCTFDIGDYKKRLTNHVVKYSIRMRLSLNRFTNNLQQRVNGGIFS